MSYILEALKRSQQERELSQIPTLANAMAAANNHTARHNYWLIAALLLAFTSMAVAIYAVTLLKTSITEKIPVKTVATKTITMPPVTTTPAVSKKPVVKLPSKTKIVSTTSQQKKKSLSKITVPKISKPQVVVIKSIDKSERATIKVQNPIQQPVIIDKPQTPSIQIITTKTTLPEISSNKEVSSNKKIELKVVSKSIPVPTPIAVPVPIVIPAPASVSNKTTTNTSKKSEASTPITPLIPPSNVTKTVLAPVIKTNKKSIFIPTDVAIAVEKFKHNLKKKDRIKPKSKLKSSITPSLIEKTPVSNTLPTEDKLPDEVQAQLPVHKIMVHAYNKNAAQSFVILNSQRLREGGETTDGLRVKSIRQDGIELEFKGQRFFKPR